MNKIEIKKISNKWFLRNNEIRNIIKKEEKINYEKIYEKIMNLLKEYGNEMYDKNIINLFLNEFKINIDELILKKIEELKKRVLDF